MPEMIGEFYYKVTADGTVAVNEMNNVERQMTAAQKRTASKIREGFSRMFGITALIGGALIAVRSLFRAIGDGISRAVDQNAELKASMQNLSDNMSAMFTRIGAKLTPILEKLAPFLNLFGQLTGQNILVQNANTTKQLDDLRKWTQYWIDSGKLSNKEMEQHKDILDQIDIKYKIIAEREAKEAEVNRKNRLDVEKKIADQLDRQANAMAEMVGNVQAVGKEILNLFPAGEASAFASSLNGIVSQFQALGKSFDSLKEIYKDSSGEADYGSIFKKIVGGTDWISLAIQGIGLLGDAISDAYKKTRDLQIAQAAEATKQTYLNYLNKLRAAYQDLTNQLIKLNFEVNKEEIIRNNTADDVQREIDAKQKLLDTNEKLIAQATRNAAEVGAQYGLGSETTDYQSWLDRASALEAGVSGNMASADYWQAIADNIFANGTDRAQAAMYAAQYRNNYNIAMAQAANIRQIGEDLQTANGLILDNLNLENDLTDLTAERLDLQNQITDELRQQTNELLRQKAALGIIDVENYGDILTTLSELRASGLSGLDLLSAASDLGISNQALRSTRIGSMIINNYSASNNSANVNGVLNTQTGA